MEIEIALGVIGAHALASSSGAAKPSETLHRSEPRSDDAKKISLSAEQRRIAESLGLSAEDLAREMERKDASSEQRAKSPFGLTAAESEVCRSLGLSERQFAIAAGRAARREEPGLLRAHQEIDRAHEATYDEHHKTNPPDRELRDAAMAELKAYDPDRDETYNHLLKGTVHAARLLNRVAPPYANQKRIGN